MGASNLSPLLILFFAFSLLQTSIIATRKSYIVYLGSHSHGPNPSTADLELATKSHHDLLGSLLGSEESAKEAIFYSYNRHINGFAAILDEKVAEELANHPNVISVLKNNGRELHTTRSWGFLGLEHEYNGIPPSSIWNAASFGESTIIANLDTGVWPESKSFGDEGYGPIPSRWRGSCEGGSEFPCNKKLIGARYFNKGYAAYAGDLNATYESARDHDGHGTHTLSTAGGDFVRGANIFGHGNGTAKGGSPKARVAAYKICWPKIFLGECFDADILAAMEAAISDGVDVISLSVGGDPKDFIDDAMAIGSFHAVQNGIIVVTSAGNSGPARGTVSNVAPWVITVGASTTDQAFTSYVALGNKEHFKGASLSDKILPAQKFYPLINAADAGGNNVLTSDAELCEEGSLDPKKVKGKIVVCLRGDNARVDKGFEAARAGAVGMILANDEQNGDGLIADAHFLPAAHVSYTDGRLVYQYINSTKTPMAYMTHVRTQIGIRPAPFMASFSSRGPNTIEESILKPDIIAPGVSIIAAFSPDATASGSSFDQRHVLFNALSGTSMSCPHVSGIVGLLKTLYPKWSPAAIRSAIMTTGRSKANDFLPIRNTSQISANAFDYGSGHVQPNKAMNPGLVYDLAIKDYLNFLCARGYNKTQIKKFSNKPYDCPKSFQLTDFNYPSISVPNLKMNPVTIKRRVKNVGTPGTYVAQVKVPRGVSVSVKPSTLKFTGIDEEKSFEVVFQSTGKGKRAGYVFGALVWSDGKHNVRSPIVVNLG